MRIAYVHYIETRDSAFNHVRQFVDAARRLGHEVDVYSPRRAAPVSEGSASTPSRRSRRSMIRTAAAKYLHEPRLLAQNVAYLPAEIGFLRRQQPDVLLARDAPLVTSYLISARRLRVPLVVEANAPVLESRLYQPEYWNLPILPQWLEGRKLARADRIVVVSQALKAHFETRHELDPEKITVAHNGADLSRFSSRKSWDRSIPGSFRAGQVVGFVGSLHAWHGPRLLAQMIRDVARLRPATCFIVVGTGPGYPEVQALTAALDGRIYFPGSVSHERVPGFVTSFDVAVMPDSNTYGSPMKVVEWMAAAKPIAAPRYAPLEELIQSGTHGLLFEPGDRHALTTAVLRLLDETDYARSLGRAAFEKARTELSWEQNARRVLQACFATTRQQGERRAATGPRAARQLATLSKSSPAPGHVDRGSYRDQYPESLEATHSARPRRSNSRS